MAVRGFSDLHSSTSVIIEMESYFQWGLRRIHFVDTLYTYCTDPRSPEYESSSWAIINLLDFYEFRSDKARVKQIKGLAKARFLGSKPECDSSIEQDGFMAICTNWAWLASKIMGQGNLIRG